MQIKIKFKFFHRRKFWADRVPKTTPSLSPSFNLREEYANAFRTESYNEFWTRVLALTHPDTATCNSLETTPSTRLPTYRLFAEHLLDPDQPTVTKILTAAQTKNCPENHSILSDYFSETANASLLCSLLLNDIDQIRLQYRPLKTALNSVENHFPANTNHFTDFSKALNPFDSAAVSSRRFRAVQAGCSSLLKRLERSREKARAKLRLINGFKNGLAVFLVALTASISIFAFYMAAHVALVAVVAVPGVVPIFLRFSSARRLSQVMAQLNAAARGTYILSRDLDTISRLVGRVQNELEHVRAMVCFALERCKGRVEPTPEVVHQLRKNDSSFSQQVDELEEHLYLCFMTINRARALVMKEVSGFSQV